MRKIDKVEFCGKWEPRGHSSMKSSYCQTPTARAKLELTLFYPCNNNKNKKNNPHQDLSEGGVLEG